MISFYDAISVELKTMLERSEKYFSKKPIVSRTASGITRLNYGEMGKRVRRLASILQKLGVGRGERVGTLAWNHHRHLEVYFAVPCNGSVLHTINIRLSRTIQRHKSFNLRSLVHQRKTI